VLQAFEVQGFQSYWQRQHVDLQERITLLAGRNDVGKSALLRAMRVFVEPQEGERSDARFVYRFRLSADDLLPVVGIDELAKQLIARHPQHTVSASFRANGPLSRSADDPGRLWCDDLALAELGLHASATRPATKMGWDEGGPLTGATLVDQFVGAVRNQASSITFITPRRIAQGPQQLRTTQDLTPDAGNLANVLFTLEHNNRDAFNQISTFIIEAFPGIDRISIGLAPAVSEPVGEPEIYYRRADDPIPLRHCGSGVEQLLALATAILTATSSRLVLIDEPQAYLHPHAERSLLALLEEHPEHQYVIATHSHQLLASRPLSQARLVTMDDAGTRISNPEGGKAVLSELGVTAADLWGHDRVLWVEGPSEVAILEMLAGGEARAEAAGLLIRRMPGSASRFSSSSPKQAEATYAFCSEVVEAVSPLPVTMRFLFDRDEKTPEMLQTIQERSRGQALFLDVREVENFFLDVELLTEELAERCRALERDEPPREVVEKKLNELLGNVADRELFPGGPPSTGADQAVDVRGSKVLESLYWEFTCSEYDKVKDGEALAKRAAQSRPRLLRDLRDILASL
jgi:energy-coupling factor transporter ATP-binding protein EcfA2